ncbi:MAG: TrmH family RNA methyltransferase [Flavobacteriia bacterium]|jgi:TrmH family RNA methyltransferase
MLSKNKIKFIKSLQLKKFRDEANLFVVEGEKSANEILENRPELISEIYYTEAFDLKGLHQNQFEVNLITEKELAQISGLKTANKILIVCKKWEVNLSDFRFILALDDIQDPGNMGTLIRLADWYGVEAIVCSNNTVELYNPKVIQAAMGSAFRTKVFHLDLREFLSKTKLPIYGALLHGENVYQNKLKGEGILILGNEGNGISEEIEKLVQHRITIPKKGKTESLNVATAGAILLSEFFRGSF